MIDARFVPITKWPGEPTKGRRESTFRATYAQTLDLLADELRHLRATEIVFEAYYRKDQIRNDGWPISSAIPSQPGVVLSFKSRGAALSFPCDRYTDIHSNLRAIALSLEALRSVDRYGVTRQSEQYAGWKQIEAPKPVNHFASKEAAAQYLSAGSDFPADDVLNSRDIRNYAYRKCAAIVHPDVPESGDPEQWQWLLDAKRLLDS